MTARTHFNIEELKMEHEVEHAERGRASEIGGLAGSWDRRKGGTFEPFASVGLGPVPRPASTSRAGWRMGPRERSQWL